MQAGRLASPAAAIDKPVWPGAAWTGSMTLLAGLPWGRLLSVNRQ